MTEQEQLLHTVELQKAEIDRLRGEVQIGPTPRELREKLYRLDDECRLLRDELKKAQAEAQEHRKAHVLCLDALVKVQEVLNKTHKTSVERIIHE